MSWDVIVVGGGPAGATVAGILLRHRPSTRVLVLERAHHPRFHVGETLVSELNRTLQELGVYEAIDEAGFIRKVGATFVWGTDDRPWDMIFGDIDTPRDVRTKHGWVQTSWTWHVERSRYDEALLRHAEGLGADVREGIGVASLIEEGGRVVGVVTDDGAEHRARFVVDATGQSGLCGSLADRQLDPILRNVAYGTYWRGFDILDRYNGDLSRSRAFIVAHPHGWSWAFPIRDDLFSVGVVTSLDEHKAAKGRDPEAFVLESVASSPELSRVLQDAELVEGPHGKRVQVSSDFSYVSRSIVQPGLARVGDAAGFVDPILSVGCFLGQTLGRYLAYALRTALDGAKGMTEERALTGYAHQVRDTLSSFRELTYFFYRFNQRPEDWWAHARRLVADTAFPQVADDKQAFLHFATGFAAHGATWREPTAVFDEGFFASIHDHFYEGGVDPEVDAALGDEDVVTLVGAPVLEDSAVPVEGEGFLAPAVRVVVEVPGTAGEAATVRRMHVPPSMAAVFDAVDGERSVGGVVDAMVARLKVGPAHRTALDRYTRWVLGECVVRGVAAVQRASVTA